MKFEDIKNMTAWELLSLLQKLVKENAEKIKKSSEVSLSGENEVNGKIKKTESSFSNKADTFKNAYLQNSKYIELHHKLFSFLNELNKGLLNKEEENVNQQTDLEEIEKIKEFEFQFCLEETIKGSIQFNSAHPFYNNQKFIQLLIDAYSKNEEYEKCAVLVKRVIVK